MILFLLPENDYDPTESAVPWNALQQSGIDVHFATPAGKPAPADTRLTDKGFGPLNPFFMTRAKDIALYRKMAASSAFNNPLSYADVDVDKYEAVLVPGGHAPGMRSMLDSEKARDIVLHFFKHTKPVAAVCHGVLLLARTIDPANGRSVLYGRKTTALPALTMELPAWLGTAPFLGSYYRTYTTTVETEVSAALASADDFKHGSVLPLRDNADDFKNGFTVRDGFYLSARWPGDCHRFASEFVAMINEWRSQTR